MNEWVDIVKYRVSGLEIYMNGLEVAFLIRVYSQQRGLHLLFSWTWGSPLYIVFDPLGVSNLIGPII